MEFWVLGIIAGLGRGKPPVPPGRGIRWSPPWREPGSRRCAPGRPTPIPWEAANGLLPGRGEPGRRDDEDPCPPEPPGRGPGRAPEREAEPSAPLEADFAPPGRGAPGRGDPPGRGGGTRRWFGCWGFRGCGFGSRSLSFGRERFAHLAHHWRFKGGRGAGNVLAHVGELLQKLLACDPDLFGDLVDAGLGHYSPSTGPPTHARTIGPLAG